MCESSSDEPEPEPEPEPGTFRILTLRLNSSATLTTLGHTNHTNTTKMCGFLSKSKNDEKYKFSSHQI